MKKTTLILLLTFILFYICKTQALPLSGSYNVGTGQTYTTLTANGGFFDAVNTNGLSGNVTVNITSDLTENAANSITQWAETGVGGYTITIKPSAAILRTISGNPNAPIINFNGADRVIIDGRFGGSGQYLLIRNHDGLYPAIGFINGAQNDTIRYCIIESSNNSTSSGTIIFSTTTGTTGNSNNVISNCDIRDRSDAAGIPCNVIYSAGTTTSASKYNSNNSILNNNIYNFYLNGGNSAGIYLGDGTSDWTISGNSFYQTVTRTPTSATGWNVIFIGSSSNNNHSILNNYIGGTTPSCGGTAWTVSGTASNFIYAIRFALSGVTTASNINGNTIANIDFTSTPATNNTLYFIGILIQAGIVNVGTTSGNSIGNSTSNGSVKVTLNGSAFNSFVRGIDHRTNGNISNNTIGSINLQGNISGAEEFDAISYQGTPSSAVTISNNTIGSGTTTNSIQTTNGSLDVNMNGIISSVNTASLTISGNTIANMNNTSTAGDAAVRGIYQVRATTAVMTIQNNNIFELSTAAINSNTTPVTCAAIGLTSGSSDVSQMISGNTIHGIRTTGNTDVYVVGMSHTERFSAGTLQKNKVYDLTNSSSTSGPAIYGLDAYWGNWNYYNNMVAITNGGASDNPSGNKTPEIQKNRVKVPYVPQDNSANGLCQVSSKDYETLSNPDKYDKPVTHEPKDVFTNGILIQAIHDEAEKGLILYYNTIYVGGNATSGSANSYCYDRPLTAWPTPVTMKDNLFYNNRTGGTGTHYAVGNEISPPNTNWNPGNYNAFVSPNAASVTAWGAGNSETIDQWRTSSGGDNQTWSTISANINSSNLFTSISTGNLNIQSGNTEAWIVAGKGIAIAGQSQDINGNSRSTSITSGCTDIGANEFAGTPPSSPNATVDNAPGSGVTSTYTLWGRTICKINWGTGGTSYPSSVNIKYYTGVIYVNAVTGNFSDSYWDVTPVGTLTNTTYDITWYFGDNETYTIASPSTSTRLAKWNSTWEVFSTQGTGVYQTELTWTSLTVKTRGLSTFSTYILTDGNAPLPVSMLYFNASASGRTVILNWATAWEMNNKGFDIERRTQTGSGNYSDWGAVGNVPGGGTTQQQRNYSYKDEKLRAGNYQYRLKQTDYNGNFEYFNLTNPDIVSINKPGIFDLHQNYPNPSNPKTKIDFEVPFTAKVSVKVYDFLGKEVITLVNETKDAGYYTTDFDGTNLASGVYFYRIIAEGSSQSFNKTMKMILIK